MLQKPRILLISPLPPPYGGISHWTTLIHRYLEGVVNVDLIQIDTAPRWRAIHTRVAYKRVIGGGVQLLRDYVYFIAALFRKPDVVHLTTSGSLAVIRDLVISISARLFCVPIVYHIRFGRIPAIAEVNSIEWIIMTWVMRIAGTTIAITPSTKQIIKDKFPDICVEYIPNPIDCAELPTPLGRTSPKKIALYLGWVIPTKGIKELVSAWAQLDPHDWELQIAGPGEVAYRQKLIEQHNPRNLKFIGELEHNEAMQVMSRCDLFVLPSYTEGFPNVILEAMALGKPIIATNVGAIPDMLANSCGLLIAPQNVEELRVAFSRLMQDETLRLELGQQAYNNAREKYFIDIIFERYMQVWQNLTQGR